MSEEQPADNRPKGEIEVWTYGGLRVGERSTRLGEWVDASGETLWYAFKRGYAVGSLYEVRVERTAEKTTRYGQPRYVGRNEDAELITRLAAEHRAAEQWFDLLRRVKKDKADDPLDAAIAELAKVIEHVPAPLRPGVINYISYKLTRSW